MRILAILLLLLTSYCAAHTQCDKNLESAYKRESLSYTKFFFSFEQNVELKLDSLQNPILLIDTSLKELGITHPNIEYKLPPNTKYVGNLNFQITNKLKNHKQALEEFNNMKSLQLADNIWFFGLTTHFYNKSNDKLYELPITVEYVLGYNDSVLFVLPSSPRLSKKRYNTRWIYKLTENSVEKFIKLERKMSQYDYTDSIAFINDSYIVTSKFLAKTGDSCKPNDLILVSIFHKNKEVDNFRTIRKKADYWGYNLLNFKRKMDFSFEKDTLIIIHESSERKYYQGQLMEEKKINSNVVRDSIVENYGIKNVALFGKYAVVRKKVDRNIDNGPLIHGINYESYLYRGVENGFKEIHKQDYYELEAIDLKTGKSAGIPKIIVKPL